MPMLLLTRPGPGLMLPTRPGPGLMLPARPGPGLMLPARPGPGLMLPPGAPGARAYACYRLLVLVFMQHIAHGPRNCGTELKAKVETELKTDLKTDLIIIFC